MEIASVLLISEAPNTIASVREAIERTKLKIELQVATAAVAIEGLSAHENTGLLIDEDCVATSEVPLLQEKIQAAGTVVLGAVLKPSLWQMWLDVGALDVVSAQEFHRFDAALRLLITHLSNVQLRTENAARAALVDTVQRLSMTRPMAAVMAVVRRAARELTGADGAAFILRDGDMCHYADEDAISPLWKGQRFPGAVYRRCRHAQSRACRYRKCFEGRPDTA